MCFWGLDQSLINSVTFLLMQMSNVTNLHRFYQPLSLSPPTHSHSTLAAAVALKSVATVKCSGVL